MGGRVGGLWGPDSPKFRAQFPTLSKFGSRKTMYGGVQYHSKREADYAAELDLRVRAGEIKSWRGQERISMIVEGVKICDYIIDFVLEYPDGSAEYVEVKGFEKPEWKLKWKLFEALYPKYKKTIIK